MKRTLLTLLSIFCFITIASAQGRCVLMDGKDFNVTIKRLVDPSAYYSTIDNTITSIEFVTGSSSTTGSVISTTSSAVRAYASYDGETKKVTITTSSTDFYAPSYFSYAFFKLAQLTSIENLAALNTSNVTYMEGMFSGCSSLTSLDLSKFDTSNVTYMGHMFRDCSSLTSLDLSKFDTSNVTYMGNMFFGCSSLTSLDLSKFDTSNVTYMGGMFGDCSSLTSLDLSKFDTSNVTDMRWMFSGCYRLTSLDLSKFDTSNVTNMNEMFVSCSSLTSLDLSKFDTSNVTDMGGMFSYCSNLTSLDLSNFDTSKVTSKVGMFSSFAENKPTSNVTCTEATWDAIQHDNTSEGTYLPSHVTWISSDAPTIYTITFKDWDGSVISTKDYEKDAEIEIPTAPTRTGHTFINWGAIVFDTAVDDAEYTAQYTINQYNITFNTNGGSAVGSIIQDYGTSITAPANPTKSGYVFVGWDKEIPATMPAEDMSINAIWGEAVTLTEGTPYANGADKEHAYVTYSRTFNNTNLQPLYIPYSMQYNDWKDDFYIYEFVGFKQGVSKTDFTSQIREVKTATEPNSIYLIKAKATGTYDLGADDVTLKAAAAEDSNPLHFEVNGINFDFYGTYQGKGYAFLYDGGSQKYWCMAGGLLCYPSADNHNNLNPYRWYLSVTDAHGASARVRIRMAIDTDDATDIEEIGEAAPQTAQDGKYIENGKVIIVKGGRKYDLNGVEMKNIN